MRHGQSLANCAGVIVSHPDNGLHDYGLSKTGYDQVKRGVTASPLDHNTRIFSSDFKRCRETAEIARDLLQCRQAEWDRRLRERCFGELELGSDCEYGKVWEVDRSDPCHTLYGVESPVSVLERAVAVIAHCEERFSSETCLLVAHGDILQILQTAFFRLSPSRHRELPHLETAEVRALTLVDN